MNGPVLCGAVTEIILTSVVDRTHEIHERYHCVEKTAMEKYCKNNASRQI